MLYAHSIWPNNSIDALDAVGKLQEKEGKKNALLQIVLNQSMKMMKYNILLVLKQIPNLMLPVQLMDLLNSILMLQPRPFLEMI